MLHTIVLLRASRVPARLGWFDLSGWLLRRASVEVLAVEFEKCRESFPNFNCNASKGSRAGDR